MASPEVQIICPHFQNGWQNYNNSYDVAKIYKYPSGQVVLSGLITGNYAQVMFTLPEGWRPKGTLIFPVCTNGNNFGRVDVLQNGTVKKNGGSGSGWLSLNGISFQAEN